MKIRDVMTDKVVTIGSEQTIIAAAARMRELDVGSLVVQREGSVEGIITTWDLTARCLGAGHDPHECVVFRLSKCVNILFGSHGRMRSCFYRVLFGRQSECVPTHRDKSASSSVSPSHDVSSAAVTDLAI